MVIQRKFKRMLLSLMAFTVLLSSLGPTYASASSAVTSAGATVISTASELDTIVRKNLTGNYILGSDIDLTNYVSSTNSISKGWDAPGDFKGTFDGAGHTIRGLWSKDRGSNQGLFSWIKGGTVKNLTIVLDPRGITGSGERKGALAGNVYSGSVVSNVHVVGAANGSPISGGANYIAGLAGVIYQSTVENASVSNVSLSGNSYVAGVAGVIYYQSNVTCSYAEQVNVYASSSYAGGFAGAVYDKTPFVSDCAVFGANVTSKGAVSGGFTAIAYDTASLTKCYADNIKVKAYSYAGGFAGQIHGSANVSQSCAQNGTAETTDTYIAGGFVGEFAYWGSIIDCYAQIDVTSKTSGAGAFIGYYSGTGKEKFVRNTYGAGTVRAGKNLHYGAYTGFSNASTSTYLGTNYYDSQLTAGLPASGTNDNGAGTGSPVGYNTATMMQKKTFVGWDFNSIWKIDEGKTYPYFQFSKCLTGITISFDKNAADATGTMASQSFTKNVSGTLNTNQFIRPGYTFTGWSTSPTGSVVYTDGASASFSTCTTLYAMWTPAIVNITVVFNKNDAGATGTMPSQTMQQNVSTALNKNQFLHDDCVFLGWSTTPAGGVQFANGASVSFSHSTTLYAVWGEPDLYGGMVGNRDTAYVGDTIKYTVTLGNQSTAKSTPLYDTVLEIGLSEHVSFSRGSILATKNGAAVTLSTSYNPVTHSIIIVLGQLDPGVEFVINFDTTVLASGEGKKIQNTFSAYGDLVFAGARSLQSKPYYKTFTDNSPVTVTPVPQSSGATTSTGKKGIGGGTTTTVN